MTSRSPVLRRWTARAALVLFALAVVSIAAAIFVVGATLLLILAAAGAAFVAIGTVVLSVRAWLARRRWARMQSGASAPLDPGREVFPDQQTLDALPSAGATHARDRTDR